MACWRRRFYTSQRGCPPTEDEKGSRCESDTGPLLYSARLLHDNPLRHHVGRSWVVRAVSQKTCPRNMPFSASASGRRLRDPIRAQGTIDISVQTQSRSLPGSMRCLRRNLLLTKHKTQSRTSVLPAMGSARSAHTSMSASAAIAREVKSPIGHVPPIRSGTPSFPHAKQEENKTLAPEPRMLASQRTTDLLRICIVQITIGIQRRGESLRNSIQPFPLHGGASTR